MNRIESEYSMVEHTQRNLPLTIALTGGIASGKTTVSEYFRKLGVPVIDTDVIARKLVNPNQPALKSIIREFGPSFLGDDGILDRLKMRELVFSDPQARTRLERILHPLIAQQVSARIGELDCPYCILVIPLLYESSSYDWADRVLVVDIPKKIQLRRLIARDNISSKLANAILQSQSTREERLSIADDVIENSGDSSDLVVQIELLNRKYLDLANFNA